MNCRQSLDRAERKNVVSPNNLDEHTSQSSYSRNSSRKDFFNEELKSDGYSNDNLKYPSHMEVDPNFVESQSEWSEDEGRDEAAGMCLQLQNVYVFINLLKFLILQVAKVLVI